MKKVKIKVWSTHKQAHEKHDGYASKWFGTIHEEIEKSPWGAGKLWHVFHLPTGYVVGPATGYKSKQEAAAVIAEIEKIEGAEWSATVPERVWQFYPDGKPALMQEIARAVERALAK